jgi:hypothetical protein
MRISKLIFVCVCLIGLTQIGWSQNQHLSKQSRGIPGYLDPRSGTFTTRAQSSGTNSEGAELNPALTTILARLIFNFTILNDQPANAVTSCTVALSTLDDSSGLFYDESATSIATKSGTACTVTILFSWALASPTTDTISVDYHISSFQAITVGGTSTPEALRTADHSIANIPVPMNGQTITEPTISTTI